MISGSLHYLLTVYTTANKLYNQVVLLLLHLKWEFKNTADWHTSALLQKTGHAPFPHAYKSVCAAMY